MAVEAAELAKLPFAVPLDGIAVGKVSVLQYTWIVRVSSRMRR